MGLEIYQVYFKGWRIVSQQAIEMIRDAGHASVAEMNLERYAGVPCSVCGGLGLLAHHCAWCRFYLCQECHREITNVARVRVFLKCHPTLGVLGGDLIDNIIACMMPVARSTSHTPGLPAVWKRTVDTNRCPYCNIPTITNLTRKIYWENDSGRHVILPLGPNRCLYRFKDTSGGPIWYLVTGTVQITDLRKVPRRTFPYQSLGRLATAGDTVIHEFPTSDVDPKWQDIFSKMISIIYSCNCPESPGRNEINCAKYLV